MTLCATFSGAEFPEERRALLLSGDATGLRDLADRFDACRDGAVPTVGKVPAAPRLSVRLAFCDSAAEERFSASGAQVLLRMSRTGAATAAQRVRRLLDSSDRAFRYLDLRHPAHAAFCVVVMNY